MKQNMLIGAAILLLAACKTNDKKGTTSMEAGKVTISGTIKGADSGYLELGHLVDDQFKIDSIKVNQGKFSLDAEVPEPTYYYLRVAGEQSTRPLQFFADAGSVVIDGSTDSIYKASVKGGPTQEEYKKASEGLEKIVAKAEPYYQQYNEARQKGDMQTVQSIQLMFDSLTLETKKYIVDYATANKSSIVSAALVNMTMDEKTETDELAKLYEGFTDPIKKSIPGQQLKKAIDGRKSTAVGAVAADFTQKDVNGKPVSLSSFRGKYVLVDFWASWCGPCRGENPNVVKAYNSFKAKGFDILGVSLDESKEDWTAAIAKDKLTWTQVSDLKGWANVVAQQYKIQSIPASFLLDKEGKIIARDLRGEDLENKLKELMP